MHPSRVFVYAPCRLRHHNIQVLRYTYITNELCKTLRGTATMQADSSEHGGPGRTYYVRYILCLALSKKATNAGTGVAYYPHYSTTPGICMPNLSTEPNDA